MKEVFRIEIPIDVNDKTAAGVNSASKRLNAFDKTIEKVQKRLKAMNSEKLKVAIEAVDKTKSVLSKIGTGVKSLVGKSWRLTIEAAEKVTAVKNKVKSALDVLVGKEWRTVISAKDFVTDKIKGMISWIGKLTGAAGVASTVLGGLSIKNALAASGESARMQTQLKVSTDNMGIDQAGYNKILRKAGSMQRTTMYSDDAMVGSAAELATYFEDSNAIIRMMDTVADYAAGMSGGVELSTEQIVDYTTNLAKMTTGAFDAMTKKGFEVTDAQKKILKSGTDMQKVAVIEDIIKANWQNMSKAMLQTPTGQLARLKNAWGDVSELVGDKLTPTVVDFLNMLYDEVPGISDLVGGVAGDASSWFATLIPDIKSGIEKAVGFLSDFRDRAKGVFASDEFKSADLFGKISIAWHKIIAEPFAEWWESTGREWFAQKAAKIGEGLGNGVSGGLLALLGIDLDQTTEEGKNVGGAFIEGFKTGFNGAKIKEAFSEWLSENSGLAITAGTLIGGKVLLGGLEKISMLKGLLGKGGSGTGGLGSSTVATMTVTAGVVNLNSKLSGSTPAKEIFSPSGKGGASGAAGAAGAAAKGGIVGLLGKIGAFFGTGATTAAGTAVAGGASVAGAAGGIAGLTSSVIDLIQGIKANKAGSKKEAKDEFVTSGTKAGLVAAGAGIGAAIGSVVPVVGTGVGALAGAGIGGVASLFAGDKAGKAISDSTDDGGFLSEAWNSIMDKYNEVKGKLADKLGEGIDSWLETLDGVEEDVGGFFSDVWSNVSGFFSESVPTWAESVWSGHVVPFFTSDVPQFVSDIWTNVSGFFTETIPTWATSIWTGHISPFFAEKVPSFFDNLWTNVTSGVTAKISSWGSAIATKVSGWWSTVSGWFDSLWGKIKGAFSSGDGIGKHAWGGIMNSPHMAMVAEDGAEAIIPLSPSKRARGMDLWMAAGQMMGVRPYADGDIVGQTDSQSVSTSTAAYASRGENSFEISVNLSPEFVIQSGGNVDENGILALLREHIREMADDISDELADNLAKIFANMPLKGVT